MGALHGPSILQAIEGKDVQQPPLPEGELSITSFFSAINSDESGKSEGINMCLIATSWWVRCEPPGRMGRVVGGTIIDAFLASTTRLSGCGRALQEPTSPNQSPPQSLREWGSAQCPCWAVLVASKGRCRGPYQNTPTLLHLKLSATQRHRWQLVRAATQKWVVTLGMS